MKVLGVFAALVIGLFALLPPAMAQDQHKNVHYMGARSVVLPLEQGPDAKLYVKVQSKGRELIMIVDTGGATLLDLEIAKALGLKLEELPILAYGLVGPAAQRFQAQADFNFSKLQIFNFPVAVVDLSGAKARSREHGHPEFDGIIGGELLSAFKARIDYRKRTLTLTQP